MVQKSVMGKTVIASIGLLLVGLTVSLIGNGLYFSQKAPGATAEVAAPTAKHHVSADEFVTRWKTSAGLFNPYRLQRQGQFLIVQDADADAPFLKFDTAGQFRSQLGGWGEGPGEFGKQPRLAGRFGAQVAVLSDDMRRRVMRFDLTTDTYGGEMQVPASAGPPATDSSLIVVRPSHPEHVLQGFQVDPSGPALPDDQSPIAFGRYDELPELAASKENYLLKQGPMHIEPSGPLYMAFRYAGLVVSFRRDGTLRFKTSDPLDIPLPDFSADDVPIPDVTAASPPGNIYPKVFIGLSVDDSHVYALYSGKKLTEETGVTGINQGSRVYAYDKNAGNLLFSFDLPRPARDLIVTSESVYILSTDPDVALLKLSRPF